MFVKNHMIEKEMLTLVELEDSLETALKKMASDNFLSLPVVDNGELRGKLMKEKIYWGYVEEDSDSFSEFTITKKVSDLYDDKIQFVYEDDEIEKASFLLGRIKMPFLTVINSDNEFVGILTHAAIFNAFSRVIGLDKGHKIVVDMEDEPGQLARFTELLKNENVNIINISIVGRTEDNYLRNVIRVETEDVDDLVDKIKSIGFRVNDK